MSRLSGVMLAVTILSTACAAPQPPEPSPTPQVLFFPRYRPLDAVPAALITGELRLRDGCLWLASSDADYLVLWPTDAELRPAAGTPYISLSGAVVPVGTRVRLAGGEYRDDESSGSATAWIEEELIGRLIPDTCRRGRYWLATEISPV